MATKTGTFQQIYKHLSEDEQQCVVDELMQYLIENRNEAVTDTIRGVNLHAFQLPTYILRVREKPADSDTDTLFMTCRTPSIIWDRIRKPSLEASQVGKETCEFYEKTMPKDCIFRYAQMDLRPSNVLVKSGHFSGFASDSLAGYFPSWFQTIAIATLHHFFEDSTSDEQVGLFCLVRGLTRWRQDAKNSDNPLADSVWCSHVMHPDRVEFEYGKRWFEFWYLMQTNPDRMDDLSTRERITITALAGYLEDKQKKLEDVEDFDFFG